VSRKRDGAVDDVVLTLAGLADLALSQVTGLLAPIVKRADLHELTREGHADLRARGELALDRTLPAMAPAHLEILARRAKKRAPGDA
jgi:hypothetical protein